MRRIGLLGATAIVVAGCVAAGLMVPLSRDSDRERGVRKPLPHDSVSPSAPSQLVADPPTGTPGLDPYPTDRQIEKGAGGWRLSLPDTRRPKVRAEQVVGGPLDKVRGPRARLRVASVPHYTKNGIPIIRDRLVWVVMVPDEELFVSGGLPRAGTEQDRPDYGLTTGVALDDAQTGKELIGTQVLSYGQAEAASGLTWPDVRYPSSAAVAAQGYELMMATASPIGITEVHAQEVATGHAVALGEITAPMTARLRMVSSTRPNDGSPVARPVWIVLAPHERGAAVWLVDAWNATLLRSFVLG